MGEARSRYRVPDPELEAQLEDLLDAAYRRFGRVDGEDYVRQLVVSALRLVGDRADRADLLLANSALKELRHSFRVFAPFRHVRKISVFGSARTPPDHPDWKQAERFARALAREGWMVITGAGSGIMQAAQAGAGREASFGVNIQLPFEQVPNQVIAGDPKLINFRYFFTRKVVFVKESHALALFPGGFGTHDESFEVLTLIQTGKSEMMPVVFVDEPGGSYWLDWLEYVRSHLAARGMITPEDLSLFRVTDDVEDAVAEVLRFYANYHSSRYVGDQLVLRVRRAPDAAELERLNHDFGDIVEAGRIEVRGPLSPESDDAPTHPRIVFRFDRRKAGRLRQLIDRLNTLVPDRSSPREASPREIPPAPIPAEARRHRDEE